MRRYGYRMLGVVLVLAGVWATAEVSLHEFGPGTVIRSTEVNENFLALADALATKQGRVAGECAAGSSIRVINEDGTGVCHVDQVGGGGGGFAGVASDGTLAGDGTSGAPLGLADGVVTGSKLSDFGASAG